MKLVVTMKQLIVVVFILAILVSLVSKELVKRRNAFLYDVAYHTRREVEELRNLENLGKMRREKSSNLKDESLAKLEKSSQLRVSYHSEMKLRFQSAANHPWQSVGPIREEPGEALLWEAFLDDPLPSVNF